MISTRAVNEGEGIRSPVPFSTAGMAGPAGDLVPSCSPGTVVQGQDPSVSGYGLGNLF